MIQIQPAVSSPANNKKIFFRSPANTDEFVKQISFWSWIILCLCIGFQCLLFGSYNNLVALAHIALAWAATTKVLLNYHTIKKFPLSSFLILGFSATQFYFPLFFTSVENKPVVFNLDLPFQVFFHSLVSLIVLLASHLVYRFFFKNNFRTPHSLLYRLGFFKPPLDAQLWIMGFTGLLASYYVFFISPSIGRQVTGNVSDKIIQSLIPFSYAPFFIPFGKLFGNQHKLTKNLRLMLVCFTVLLFIVSIGRNSRGAFMMGFTSLGFAYGLGLMLGIFKPYLFTVKNLLLGLAGFWLITGPLADLGTAMVIVRNDRNDVKASELISLTLVAFQDKKAIKARRDADNLQQDDWDERYLNNIFTARFSNLKFNDASLVQASKIGDKNAAMLDYSVKYAWGALPDPVLKAFNIDVDKNYIYSVSFGDYIYNLAGAGYLAFGGFRTGHFAGTGMAAFGWWYLLILGIGMFPVFFLLDKLALIRRKTINMVAGTNVQFSLCGLLSLTPIFQFLPSESVISVVVFLLRGWLQMVFLYFIMFHFTRVLAVNISKRNT